MSLIDDSQSFDDAKDDKNECIDREIEDNNYLKYILLELRKLNQYMEIITEEQI